MKRNFYFTTLDGWQPELGTELRRHWEDIAVLTTLADSNQWSHYGVNLKAAKK